MPYEQIFSPLAFRHLTTENRILRSSIAGHFDNYERTGARPRIHWELEFARGGVGAIVVPPGRCEESRFPSRDAMIREILSVYNPQTFQ